MTPEQRREALEKQRAAEAAEQALTSEAQRHVKDAGEFTDPEQNRRYQIVQQQAEIEKRSKGIFTEAAAGAATGGPAGAAFGAVAGGLFPPETKADYGSIAGETAGNVAGRLALPAPVRASAPFAERFLKAGGRVGVEALGTTTGAAAGGASPEESLYRGGFSAAVGAPAEALGTLFRGRTEHALQAEAHGVEPGSLGARRTYGEGPITKGVAVVGELLTGGLDLGKGKQKLLRISDELGFSLLDRRSLLGDVQELPNGGILTFNDIMTVVQGGKPGSVSNNNYLGRRVFGSKAPTPASKGDLVEFGFDSEGSLLVQKRTTQGGKTVKAEFSEEPAFKMTATQEQIYRARGLAADFINNPDTFFKTMKGGKMSPKELQLMMGLMNKEGRRAFRRGAAATLFLTDNIEETQVGQKLDELGSPYKQRIGTENLTQDGKKLSINPQGLADKIDELESSGHLVALFGPNAAKALNFYKEFLRDTDLVVKNGKIHENHIGKIYQYMSNRMILGVGLFTGASIGGYAGGSTVDDESGMLANTAGIAAGATVAVGLGATLNFILENPAAGKFFVGMQQGSKKAGVGFVNAMLGSGLFTMERRPNEEVYEIIPKSELEQRMGEVNLAPEEDPQEKAIRMSGPLGELFSKGVDTVQPSVTRFMQKLFGR